MGPHSLSWRHPRHFMKALTSAFILLYLCVGYPTSHSFAAEGSSKAASRVRLGMSKAEVVRLLEPEQRRFGSAPRKRAELYSKGSTHVEIVYFRGGAISGSRDSEGFTPYVFYDGELIAVGWPGLGSPAEPKARPRSGSAYSATIIPPY